MRTALEVKVKAYTRNIPYSSKILRRQNLSQQNMEIAYCSDNIGFQFLQTPRAVEISDILYIYLQ